VETSRVALIRYQSPDGSRYVGTGLVLDDRQVLTADHVADGTGHRVTCGGGDHAVASVLRSRSLAVDIALLTLSEPIGRPGRLSCAQVDRSRVNRVTGCVAVGFPRWRKDKDQRLTAQVYGWVPTAEGLDPAANAGLRAGLLTLVGDRIPGAPPIPETELRDSSGSAWGGMSGAGVVVDDLVIGVVRSHNLAAGGQSLTVTPLTALEQLPAELRQQFWAALGIKDPAQLPVLPDAGRSERHERPQVSAKPVRLAPRPLFLAGREELLAEVDSRLKPGEAEVPRVVALCGLGGAGKTSVAVEYAYRQIDQCDLVWQFAAEDPAGLADGFSELAAQLRIRDEFNAADPVSQVHAVLAARPGDWLLVFDNAPDETAVQKTLPPAGAGRVLITSRDSAWPAAQAIEVPVLSDEVAAAFLVQRTGCTGQEEEARELARELGGLPLALEQAGAYMQAANRGIDSYLALFRQRRGDLLARGKPTGYEKQVATTWALAFDQIKADQPGAIGLLHLLACCAPEAIPLDRLMQPRPDIGGVLGAEISPVLVPLMNDPLALDDAIVALRRYSLISPLHEGTVSVHRLVQAVTLAQLTDEQAMAWRRAAGFLIEAALPSDPRQSATWPAYSALLPHARAALTYASDGLAKVAIYLGQSGNYAAARQLQQHIVADREQVLGAEHPETLEARGRLADWIGQSGEAARARDLHVALLAVYERVLGAEHPRTLTERDNVGRWTGKAGDFGRARDMYAALLPVRLRVSGPDDPDTLLARSRLARWTGQAGDPVSARDQYAALLPAFQRVLGAENFETLALRANMATMSGQAGDAVGARDQLTALLPVMERVLGSDHPYTLIWRSNIAGFTGHAGDAVRARDLLAGLLPVQERVCGPEHFDTLNTSQALAEWTGLAGDAAGARDLLAALLPVDERVLGPDNVQTLSTRLSLAAWTGAAGDAAKARDLFAAVVPVLERLSGTEAPLTLQVRLALARWTGQAGDAAEARDLLAVLAPTIEKVFGKEHLAAINARTILAACTAAAGDRAGGREQLAALQPVFQRVFGAEHPETVALRAQVAALREDAKVSPR
jgi:hypothetical protein